MRAKKSLGQHFLRSDKALKSIVNAGEVSAEDLVLEIGPGQGDLTQRLLMLAAKVVAIEKDDDLYELLKTRFSSEIETGRLDLIHGDILEFDPEILRVYKDLTYKLIANIPYNITGAIFKKFLSAKYQPERMVLLVQKEVAERIVAKDSKESILSISVKAYGTPHYVEKVPRGAFAPAPNVDSAIISIENISKNFFKDFREEEFFSILRGAFKSKRKKLSSNLSTVFDKNRVEEMFDELGLDDNIRPEDVRIEVWKALTKILLTDIHKV